MSYRQKFAANGVYGLNDSGQADSTYLTQIDATKIGSGNITNTMIESLFNIDSNIQAQIDTITSTIITQIVSNNNSLSVIQDGNLTNIQILNVEATDIADGSVTNFAFQQVANASSNIQMQIDALVAGRSYRGGYDASSNLFPSTGGSGVAGAIKAGDQWDITVAGILGGVEVSIGTIIRSLIDAPGQTRANWTINADGVSLVFGRSGVVVAQADDYNITQITNGLSNILASGSMFIGNISNIATEIIPSGAWTINNSGISILSAGIDALKIGAGIVNNTKFGYLTNVTSDIQSQINTISSGLITSVFGRSGPTIIAQVGDYTVSQITDAASIPYVDAGLATKEPTITQLPIVKGGTGQSTANAAFNALAPAQATNTNKVLKTDGTNTSWVDISTLGVSSFNTRTGPVTSQTGDYAFSQISGTAASTQGGTGFSSFIIGDIFSASSTTALSKIAAVSVGSVFASMGTGTLPAWTNAPAFGGNPTAPNLLQNDSSTKLANTNYVDTGLATKASTASVTTALALKADLASPTLTGAPAAPTAALGTSTTQLATTAFVINSIPNRATVTNSGLTTTTDIIIAIATNTTLGDTAGYYTVSMTDSSNNQLTICFSVVTNFANFTSQFAVLVIRVSDTVGIITKDNLSSYLTFFAHFNTSTYTAITVRMSGGLLYGSSTLQFSCSMHGISYLNDSRAITQYLATPLTNLATPTSSLLLNINSVQYATTPAASSLNVYTANGGATTLSLYGINSNTGALTVLPSSPTTIGTTPIDVAITPNGKYLYVSCQGSNFIYCFIRDVLTGALSPCSSPTVSRLGPNYFAMDVRGRFLWVLYSTSSIATYIISASTGNLTFQASIAIGTTLKGLAAHPNGLYFYAVDTSGLLFQYGIDQSVGTLTSLGSSMTITGTSNAQRIVVHPSGNFGHVVSTGNATVCGFTIASNGTTTNNSGAGTGTTPLGFCYTPNGSFAYVTNSGNATVGCYSVNSSGILTVLSTATYATGTTPTCVRTDAGGRFLYITNAGSNTISMFSIASTGALTSIATAVATGSTPNQLNVI